VVWWKKELLVVFECPRLYFYEVYPEVSPRGTWLAEGLDKDSGEPCDAIATDNCYKLFFCNLYWLKLYLY
jgi:hypothetical protein